MKTFKEYLGESKITNVNIGVSKKNKDLINQIEDDIDKEGAYFDNEGSDNKTHNINAGFKDRKKAEKFENKWSSKVDFIELETLSI